MWFYFSIGAAILWAIATIIDEYTVDKYVKNPLINAFFYSLVGLISGIVIFIYEGSYPLDLISLIMALVAGASYTITISMYFFALKEEEVTRVVPLISLSSISTVILAAIFLKEVFPPVTYLGIFLIILGAGVISVRSVKGKKNEPFFKISLALLFIFIGSVFAGLSGVLEKMLMNNGIPSNIVFGYSRIGVAIPAVAMLFFLKKEITRIIDERKHHIFLFMMGSEFVTIIGTFLIFIALSLGPLTLVSAISTIEPVFTLLFATLLGLFIPNLLKQELNKRVIIQKVIAILLIISGAILTAT